MGFETASTSTINYVVYAEYDNVLEIDFTHQILSDFSTQALKKVGGHDIEGARAVASSLTFLSTSS